MAMEKTIAKAAAKAGGDAKTDLPDLAFGVIQGRVAVSGGEMDDLVREMVNVGLLRFGHHGPERN